MPTSWVNPVSAGSFDTVGSYNEMVAAVNAELARRSLSASGLSTVSKGNIVTADHWNALALQIDRCGVTTGFNIATGGIIFGNGPTSLRAFLNTAEGQSLVGNSLWKTLNNPNAYGTSANDLFGYSVAISGDYVVVSAYLEGDAGGTESGKVYIFTCIS